MGISFFRCVVSSVSRRCHPRISPVTNRSFVLRLLSSQILMPPDVAGRRAYELRHILDSQPTANGRRGCEESMSTLLSHAGLPPHEDGNEPLSPPIDLATTYERPPDGDYSLGSGRIYARTDNPTREALERAIAAAETLAPRRKGKRPEYLTMLADTDVIFRHNEDGDDVLRPPSSAVCAAFSSGMAAVSSVVLSLTAPVHVVLPDDAYHGVLTAFFSVFRRHGVTWRTVDMTDIAAVENELRRCAGEVRGRGDVVLWMETPSNPLCKITDIEELCRLADGLRSDGVFCRGVEYDDDGGLLPTVSTVVDSTWAPPPITQPLLLGADAVMHSATKYLGGHSDVLMGVVSASSGTPSGLRLGASLKNVQGTVGSVASPLDSWLTLRGIRTLDVRLRRQCRSAAEIAQFISSHAQVERVHYPGLPSHPGHAVASRQMSDGMYGGMLSFEVRDEPMAMAVAGAVRTVRRATSLGGTETLIEHRASIEPEGRRTSPPGLLRVSVGLEDPDDLMEDLNMALRVGEKVVGRGAG